jgi:PPOX class probable F420-dependent enzyme
LAPPSSVGEPLTRWSLRRLRGYLVRRRVVPSISIETIRSILAEAHASFQRTRSWKRSPDAQFEAKAARVLALSRQCPPGGVVVCFDEFGPISLQPYPGHCYARRQRPWRQRATYTRRGGVGDFFGAYDVHTDLLFGGYRLAKTTTEVLACYQSIRRRYADDVRIYLVNDNLSLHWTPQIRAWAEAHNVELVATPTSASYATIQSVRTTEATGEPFAALRGHGYLRLATFRKSGVPVATPVWFAHDGSRLVITTAVNAGKVKRLRHTPSVRVAPIAPWGAIRGPELEAVARLLPTAEHARAEAALRRKYGWQWRWFNRFGRKNEYTYLEVRSVG